MVAKHIPDRAPPRRARLAPGEREQMILEAAVTFFADHGFHAQIRQLAERIGVSTGLIFRYFETKDVLIERVYQQVFVSRWRAEWTSLITQSDRPIRDRLIAFYRSYLSVVDDRDWICIAMRASLEGNNITRRYIDQHVNGLLKLIATELRETGHRAHVSNPTPWEMETVWNLHSSVIYYAIRKHIHQVGVLPDRDAFVELMVDEFLGGFSGSARRKQKARPHAN